MSGRASHSSRRAAGAAGRRRSDAARPRGLAAEGERRLGGRRLGEQGPEHGTRGPRGRQRDSVPRLSARPAARAAAWPPPSSRSPHCTSATPWKSSQPLATCRGAPDASARVIALAARTTASAGSSRSRATSARHPVEPHALAPPVAPADDQVRGLAEPDAASASSPSPTASAASPSSGVEARLGGVAREVERDLVAHAGPRRAARAGGRCWPCWTPRARRRSAARAPPAARSRAARAPPRPRRTGPRRRGTPRAARRRRWPRRRGRLRARARRPAAVGRPRRRGGRGRPRAHPWRAARRARRPRAHSLGVSWPVPAVARRLAALLPGRRSTVPYGGSPPPGQTPTACAMRATAPTRSDTCATPAGSGSVQPGPAAMTDGDGRMEGSSSSASRAPVASV